MNCFISQVSIHHGSLLERCCGHSDVRSGCKNKTQILFGLTRVYSISRFCSADFEYKESHEVQDLFQIQFALLLLINFPAKSGVIYLKILPKKLLLRSKRRKNGDQVGELLAGASWEPIARGGFRLISGELLPLSAPFLFHSPSPIEQMHKKIMAVYLLSEISEIKLFYHYAHIYIYNNIPSANLHGVFQPQNQPTESIL